MTSRSPLSNQDDIPGTGRAVQCAMAQLTRGWQGLDGAGADRRLRHAAARQRDAAPVWSNSTTASGNGATVLTTILDDPTGYGRIIRDQRRQRAAHRRAERRQPQRTRRAGSEHLSLRVRGHPCSPRPSPDLKSNNAQGEFYLTDALEAAKADWQPSARSPPRTRSAWKA